MKKEDMKINRPESNEFVQAEPLELTDLDLLGVAGGLRPPNEPTNTYCMTTTFPFTKY